ncbi:Arm DNA-binding domain-containing protein [Chania multitudinisentens]|uniref:Arm DNA-binding domain-containing protein n=1 Tax=Chania multitudinisentens TaxID=1639108 RepID=UPI0009005305
MPVTLIVSRHRDPRIPWVKKLAIGVYPDFSLADTRLKRDEARKMLTNGLDPSGQKQLEK